MDPVAGAGVVIGLLALGVAAYNLWRAEIRGPAVRVWAASGSTFARIAVPPSEPGRLVVNVYRDVLVSNDSARPGYLGAVMCEPHGSLEGMTIKSITVGIVYGDAIVPPQLHTLNMPIERGSPVRLMVSWWLDLAPEDDEAIRAQIRAPQGSLAMKVMIVEYRNGRSRRHDLIVRPKSSADELIMWSAGSPWAI